MAELPWTCLVDYRECSKMIGTGDLKPGTVVLNAQSYSSSTVHIAHSAYPSVTKLQPNQRANISPLRTIMWNFGVATVIVAPLALGLGGRLALAWGLGWSWTAILVWTLNRLPQGVWLIGLSAGGAVAVGSFGLAPPSFRSVLLGVIIWGLLGGIAWRTQPGIARADVRTLGKTIVGGLFVGFFGSLLAALIGNLLLRVDLKVAGFAIGFVLMGPCWTVGMVSGIMLGSLANRGR